MCTIHRDSTCPFPAFDHHHWRSTFNTELVFRCCHTAVLAGESLEVMCFRGSNRARILARVRLERSCERLICAISRHRRPVDMAEVGPLAFSVGHVGTWCHVL